MGATLRIGIITAYLAEDWHSQQLVASANRQGIAQVVIRPESLGARLTPQGVTVLAQGVDLGTLDGYILARGFGDVGNSDFLIPVYQILERNGYVLVNGINAVLTAVDKFETSCRLQQANIPTPSVVVAQDIHMAQEVLAVWKKLVVKPLFGSLGLGIELLEDTAHGRSALPRLLAQHGAVYLQEYVPTPGRDIRAFVVGSRVAASMYRFAPPGEWRTNVYQGAFTESCTLDAETARMAVAAAQAIGLDYTGVDILEGPDGPLVIEVNGNPLWRGLLETTGHNMADDIVARVAERITRTTTKGG
jgi:ribosomal protein S6--L-glutamate ligase